MIYAYLRVSTEKQHLENQKEEILRFSLNKELPVDHWYTEIVSGTKSHSGRVLSELFGKAVSGDKIIVSEISRLSRKMYEIMSIFNHCINNEITLYSVKEGYVIGDDISSKITGFAFCLAAEIERSLISMRTREALAVRKQNGIKLGRPRGSGRVVKIIEQNGETILNRISANESVSSIALDYKISRTSIYNFLRQNR